MMQTLDPLAIPCEGLQLIEASAGTGKTYTIAALYLRLMLEKQLDVRQILVVTYTVAATEELRGRLRARLREALAVLKGGEPVDDLIRAQIARVADREEAKRQITNAIACMDEAAILTIHGFCQRMLQENAFESGTLFDAELVENEGELISAIVEDFWRRHLEGASLNTAVLLSSSGIDTPAALLGRLRPYLAHNGLEVRPLLDPSDFRADALTECIFAMASLWEQHRSTIVELLGSPDLRRGPYKPESVAAAAGALDEYFAGAPTISEIPDGIDLFTPANLDANLKPAKKTNGAVAPTHPFFDACGRFRQMQEQWLMAFLQEAMSFVQTERRRRKEEHGLLAFDDLLTNLRAAVEGPQGAILAERIGSRFPAALIDEFQDTDPEQYRIFSGIYRGRRGSALFMIGDPKQAIYGFRGADVFTYMGAKEDTREDARYTLDTNWRSTDSLIKAVNALFLGAHAPFIYEGQIDFLEMHASGKAEKDPLVISGSMPSGLTVWMVSLTEENQFRGCIKGEWAKEYLPQYCAEEIVRLLNLGAGGAAQIKGEPLQPRDIAVLVRDRYEAGLIQEALRGRGVNSACYGRESVYASEEAEELERILLAMAEPAKEGILRAALCSILWGMDGAELATALDDEEVWESLVVRVQGYQQLWLNHGFMPMFRRFLQEQDVAVRFLRLTDGERRLTNLLQIAELLQAASRKYRGIERLLRWYAEQRAEPDGESEEQQLRLESDADLVKIVTVHKSKGLEYPVVFLPFAWKARPVKDGPVLFHEPNSRRAVVDFSGAPESRALAERERLAEELRLFYVALTRAKYMCYLPWGRFHDMQRGALAWLLHGAATDKSVKDFETRLKGLDDDALHARLQEWSTRAGGEVVVAQPPVVTSICHMPRAGAPRELKARKWLRHSAWNWRITSYTGLVAGHGEERPDHGSIAEDHAGDAAPVMSRTILEFPRGSRAGTFMHRVFERIDFPEARADVLQQVVQRELARQGYGTEWSQAVEEMVGSVLDAPLADGLRLRDITSRKRLIELEFHYPLSGVRAEELERLVTGLGGYEAGGSALRFEPVTGIMRGFIDLVFEHEGRYFIADYKSNYLGSRPEHYHPETVQKAIFHNRYHLQYLIYTVALHRYLRRRIADYEYQRHFGGVYYLFVRGMSPSVPGNGVYTDLPDAGLIESLDALFAGKQP